MSAAKFVIVEVSDLADIVRKAVREEVTALVQGEVDASDISPEELARFRRKLAKRGIGA